MTTSYAYTNGSALAAIDYSDDTPDVAFTYDRLGRQKVAQTFLSAHRYAYDPVTLALASETIIDPQNAVTNVITRTTDTLGRDTGFSLGDDYAVVYGYDDFGRFHSVSSTVASAKSEATYGYLAGSDLLAAMTNSWGFSWTRAFETNRNLIAAVENRFDEALISAFDYANDSLARRTRRVDNLNVTNDFGYNVRSEVIDAAMGTNNYGYVYDPIGNRLAATNNQEGWVYQSNPLNQYTNIADGVIVEPEYDLDGNMTATGDGWWYFWNGENRMVLASNAEHVVTYAYDYQGRMVWKQFSRRGAGAQSWEVERTDRLLWDGYNIVRALTHFPTHTLTNSFVWGLDLSGSLQGAGGVGGLLAEIHDGEPYFATFDANGNVTEYISTNGVTVAHYEYSPFGEISNQSGDLADAFTHRFSTKPWCNVTGLSEYEFRKYEPGMGRWLSRDPIGERGGINVYRTLNNCAISEVDYLGLKNKIVVLFGHGSDQDEKGNWLLFEAAAWFSKLDEDDALIPFGCKTQQVRELLVKKLQTGVDSGDQQLAIMTKLAFLLTSGATWSFDMTEFNFLDLWYSMMAGLYLKRDMMCDASSNCPEDVWVSFYCQEGDEIIDKVTPIITHDYVKAIPEFKKIPAGDTFCGKTWRWSCQGKYWEYWKYGGVQ